MPFQELASELNDRRSLPYERRGELRTKVHSSCEETCAKTTDASWSDLAKVDRTNDWGLTDSKTCNQSACIDGSEVARGATDHEDGNADGPKNTELANSPDTAETIADDESAMKSKISTTRHSDFSSRAMCNLQESTANRTKLHHGRDIGLDVSLLSHRVGIIVDLALEIRRVERSRDQTLIDTTCRTEKTKRHDGEPQTPVEDALWLTEVLQIEDVDGFLDASSHFDEEESGKMKKEEKRKGEGR
jgi:hypothetical protein